MAFLVFEEKRRAKATSDYLCAFIQTVTVDRAVNTAPIAQDQRAASAQTLLEPTPDRTHRSNKEVLRGLPKALATGVQFTSETRLGRPLGTCDRPAQAAHSRADSWRSARSALHVALSLEALRDLVLHLALLLLGRDAALCGHIGDQFGKALTRLENLDDPFIAAVAMPQTRLKIDVLQKSIDFLRNVVRDKLGPTLSVAAGFNALDGD